MMKKKIFSKYIIGFGVIIILLFGIDFIANGYYKKLGLDLGSIGQGSVIDLEVSELEDNVDEEVKDEEEVVDEEVVDEDTEDGTVPVSVGKSELTEKDLFNDEVFAKAGYEGAYIEDLKYTNKLFNYFELEEIPNSSILKKVIYDDKDRAIAFVYQLPAESYVLGLDYNSLKEQMKPMVYGDYTFNEPSTFGERSFYIASSDPDEPKIAAVAEIDDTLVGFEYTRGMYPTIQKFIDVILSN